MHLLYPQPFWKEIIPRILETFLLRAVRMETGGSEASIPVEGSFVSVFASHSGWIDSIVIDECFRRVGRAWPVWLTKKENCTLPRVLTGGRIICIDRQSPEPRVVRTIHAFLRQPDAVLATGIEGTRFGNPRDPEDLRTLGAFKTGPVRFAIKAQVPILPVAIIGGDRVVPHLDRIWQCHGSLAAFRQIRQLIAHPQPIQVRFLPLYQGHLDGGGVLRGKSLGKKALLHTNRLREAFAAQILELDPGYPIA